MANGRRMINNIRRGLRQLESAHPLNRLGWKPVLNPPIIEAFRDRRLKIRAFMIPG